MSSAKMTFPTIWDQHSAFPSAGKTFLSRFWNGLIKLAEAQSRTRGNRGFLPYI